MYPFLNQSSFNVVLLNLQSFLNYRLTARQKLVTCAVIMLMMILYMGIRALIYDTPLADVAIFWGYVIVYIALPGLLLHTLLLTDRSEPFLRLGEGVSLGLALHNIVYVLFKIANIGAWFLGYGLITLAVGGLWWVRRQNAVKPDQSHITVGQVGGLILLLGLVTTAFIPVRDSSPIPISFDTLWHTGNIAELAHHWPLQNPRVAGEPLSYHLLSYAFPAAVAQVTGIAVADIVFRLSVSLPGMILAILCFNAGRTLFSSPYAGLLGGLMVFFHTDPGTLLPIGHFNSYLSVGIYGSITALYGFVLLISYALALHEWLNHAERSYLAVLALMGLAAMWTKPTIMAVVMAGLAGVIGWRLLFDRHLARRTIIALIVTGIAMLPPVIYLTLGRDNYMYTEIMRISPGESIRTAGFYQPLVDAAWWTAWVVLPIWLLGYFNIIGITAVGYIAKVRGWMQDTILWIIMVTLAGLVLVLGIGLEGASQIAFLYQGQILLALLGGAWLVSLTQIPLKRTAPVWIITALFFVPILIGLVRQSGAGVMRDLRTLTTPPDALLTAYHDGLDWVQRETPANIVIITQHKQMIISVYAERRAYYETGIFTPQAFQFQSNDAFPDRGEVQDQIFLKNDLTALNPLITEYGVVYVIVDNAQPDDSFSALTLAVSPVTATLPSGELVYENEVVRIYRFD